MSNEPIPITFNKMELNSGCGLTYYWGWAFIILTFMTLFFSISITSKV